MRLLANRSPGKGAEAGRAAFLRGPQLARGVGADFVHLGQDDPAAAGGLDSTVIGCVDQPRCVQASEITAKIAGVPVAADGGEAGRGTFLASRAVRSWPNMRIAPGGTAVGAVVLAPRAIALVTTASVSRSMTGAMRGANRSGEMSTTSGTVRPYAPTCASASEEPGQTLAVTAPASAPASRARRDSTMWLE